MLLGKGRLYQEYFLGMVNTVGVTLEILFTVSLFVVAILILEIFLTTMGTTAREFVCSLSELELFFEIKILENQKMKLACYKLANNMLGWWKRIQ